MKRQFFYLSSLSKVIGMYLTPCEIAVRDILPAIRALIVIELHNRGLKQKEIAKLLRITQPAVSYYLNRRRAKRIRALESNEDLMNEIRSLVDYLLTGNANLSVISEKFCDMCHMSRDIVLEEDSLAKEVFREASCGDRGE